MCQWISSVEKEEKNQKPVSFSVKKKVEGKNVGEKEKCWNSFRIYSFSDPDRGAIFSYVTSFVKNSTRAQIVLSVPFYSSHQLYLFPVLIFIPFLKQILLNDEKNLWKIQTFKLFNFFPVKNFCKRSWWKKNENGDLIF